MFTHSMAAFLNAYALLGLLSRIYQRRTTSTNDSSARMSPIPLKTGQVSTGLAHRGFRTNLTLPLENFVPVHRHGPTASKVHVV